MTAKFKILLLVPLFASCTAINQKDAFLDALPRPNVPIFEDNFESGLGKWNQTSGTWVTSAAGSGSLALQSPSSTTSTTFAIATAVSIDLTGRSRCFLEYDTQYLLKGLAGVSANVLFGSSIVGTLKDTSALSDISSATSFVHRKAILPDNGNGKISFVSSVVNDTTGYADWRIDNVVVKCNASASTTVTVVNEDFNASAANWFVQAAWTWGATYGLSGSGGITIVTGQNAYTGTTVATYLTPISLANRFSCQLEFFYNTINGAANNCMEAELSSNVVLWSLCGTGSAGTKKLFLTANEDTATNTLLFRCKDLNGALGGNIPCTLDQVKLTCQQ